MTNGTGTGYMPPTHATTREARRETYRNDLQKQAARLRGKAARDTQNGKREPKPDRRH